MYNYDKAFFMCHAICSLQSKLLEGGLQVDPSAHEEVTGNPEVGISIRNLTKIYSQVMRVVNKHG